MANDPHALTIHIDGSALDNPGGHGGIAGIVEYPEKLQKEPDTIFEIGFDASTNNRMELLACIKALEWVRYKAQQFSPARVVIVTDSTYVCENIGNVPHWKSNRWCNREGRPVDNPDLWKALLSAKLRTGIRTDIEWRKGKKMPIQKEVDTKAKHSAKGIKRIHDNGYRAGKIARTKLPGLAAAMFPAAGQQEIIRVYRKGAGYRTGDSKIYFEVFSEAEQRYVSKHFAYTSVDNEIELHRHHHYRVQFNDNPKYPIIVAVLEEVKTG
jgi:ribonuclease HI